MQRRSRRRWLALACGAAAVAAVLSWSMPEIAALNWYWTAGSPAMNPGDPVLEAPLRWSDDYYAVADLGHGAYAIGEPHYGQCNFEYLIVGSKRALLFDTGPGIRDISVVVRSLTALPVEALPSHLHFDHVGNLGRLDDVALPDLPALRVQVRNGRFALGFNQFLGFVEGFSRPSFAVTHWILPGADIDLGDRTLTVLSVPGHTPDSVVVIDREANRMFAGDFIYPGDLYAHLPGANLRDYADSARRVGALLDEETTIYGGHGCDRFPSVGVPVLHRSDLRDAERALRAANDGGVRAGSGWYPRVIGVNARMKLLAKYPWMRR